MPANTDVTSRCSVVERLVPPVLALGRHNVQLAVLFSSVGSWCWSLGTGGIGLALGLEFCSLPSVLKSRLE